jgi:hypothetical protein
MKQVTAKKNRAALLVANKDDSQEKGKQTRARESFQLMQLSEVGIVRSRTQTMKFVCLFVSPPPFFSEVGRERKCVMRNERWDLNCGCCDAQQHLRYLK